MLEIAAQRFASEIGLPTESTAGVDCRGRHVTSGRGDRIKFASPWALDSLSCYTAWHLWRVSRFQGR